MHKKKHIKHGTNKQEIINIGTKSPTFQEKQRPSKTDQRSTVWREEQKKQELKVHRIFHPQPRTGFDVGKGIGMIIYFVCILSRLDLNSCMWVVISSKPLDCDTILNVCIFSILTISKYYHETD
jgi:hypothetical protein